MRKTIKPNKKEYDSKSGRGCHQTEYGYIRSYSDGAWYHHSFNKQDWNIGEWFMNQHRYFIRL